MSLPTIRAALAEIAAALPPVTVTTPHGTTTLGLNQSLAYQPEVPPEVVPCAWLGQAEGDILAGSLEVWTYDLPWTVAVSEVGSAEMEWASVEAFLLALAAHMRGYVTLSGAAAACTFTHFIEGEITFKGKPYRGFTVTASIEEKFAVANDYWPQAS